MPALYSYRLDQLVKDMKFVPYKLKKYAKHEVGKTYWCSYWQKYYKVTEISDKDLITIEWEDGKVVQHRTSLDWQRDYELRPFEYLSISEDKKNQIINNDISFTAAEIKALCLVGIIDNHCKEILFDEYFSSDNKFYKPNDNTYYFIDRDRTSLVFDIKLIRDIKKSPRAEK